MGGCAAPDATAKVNALLCQPSGNLFSPTRSRQSDPDGAHRRRSSASPGSTAHRCTDSIQRHPGTSGVIVPVTENRSQSWKCVVSQFPGRKKLEQIGVSDGERHHCDQRRWVVVAQYFPFSVQDILKHLPGLFVITHPVQAGSKVVHGGEGIEVVLAEELPSPV